MPTVESSIEAALFARVAALVAVGGPLAGLTVAWPNVTLVPKPATYLRVTHVPNRSRRLFLAGSDPHQRIGLLQVDYFGTKNAGAPAATEQAGKIAAHFPADHEMTRDGFKIRVTKAPDVAQALPDDSHWMVPVTVAYEVFA